MVKVDLSQFVELLRKFERLPADIQDEVDAEIEEGAREFVRLAKIASPVDTGRLRGSINYRATGGLSYEIFAHTNYAAYQEFGTGAFVSVPPDLVEVASKFRGRGLGTGGVRARHYFYPQRAIVVPKMIKRLENVVENILR